MMLRDIFSEAYNAMRHDRRRTALTMLGMAWGIATVVMLLAYGDGFGRAFDNIFANFGTKLVIVVPGRSSMQAGGEKAGVPGPHSHWTMSTCSPPIFRRSLTSRPVARSRRPCSTTPAPSP